MAKTGSFNYTFSLLLLDVDEQVVTGFTTSRELPAARRVAKSALHLNPRAAYCDIHQYASTAAQLANSNPIARVTLDDEEE